MSEYTRDPFADGEADNPVEYANEAETEMTCECGHIVHLLQFTNTCVCGADYSMTGQRLAPREQWGEETGETVDEILSIGHHIETK